MAIEIGNLVVRGSFGPPARDKQTLSEAQVRAMLDRLRRDMTAQLDRQISASEQRLKEGL